MKKILLLAILLGSAVGSAARAEEVEGKAVDKPQVVNPHRGWIIYSCEEPRDRENCERMLGVMRKYEPMIRSAAGECGLGLYFVRWSSPSINVEPNHHEAVSGIAISVKPGNPVINAMPGHLDGVPVFFDYGRLW